MKESISVLVIFIILFMNCVDDKNKENSKIKVEAEKTIEVNELNAVISSEKLKRVLIDFIFEIDSIPNPFGRTVCYSLSFIKKDSDTLLSLEANVYFPQIIEDKKSFQEFKGFFNYYERDIAIFDYKKSLGSSFYSESNLNQKVLNQEDSLLNSYSELKEGWTFVSPYMIFEIKDNDLIKKESYLGIQ